MLECVVNVSGGRDLDALARLRDVVAGALLDVHTDPWHNRSVFTLVGQEAPQALTEAAVARLSLEGHTGAHPRLGVVDVVPFVPLDGSTMADAIAARDDFAAWAADALAVPSFLYGPERTLPELRRRAFRDLFPDVGPPQPHPTAGAICAGARPILVAYNLWLAPGTPVEVAKSVAAKVRGPSVRALGLDLGGRSQVSLNLVDPRALGPADAYDAIAFLAPVERAELVGLLPAAVLHAIPPDRWPALDVGPDRTIEARLTALERS